MEQAADFLTETEVLYALVSGRSSTDLDEPTLFKGWSTTDILAHLHFWNRAASLQLEAPDTLAGMLSSFQAGISMRELERSAFESSDQGEQVEEWFTLAKKVSEAFAETDPKARLKWVGPDMSARSSITARQMETWAHGQAIFDIFGDVRPESDRIKNIVVLGVNTFGWTYKSRKLEVPPRMPHLDLTAPSGEVWAYGTEDDEDRIIGSAVDFCQVVTQTRNVADTGLTVIGEAAIDWMSKAQCFAGPAHPPPRAGTRFRTVRT